MTYVKNKIGKNVPTAAAVANYSLEPKDDSSRAVFTMGATDPPAQSFTMYNNSENRCRKQNVYEGGNEEKENINS